MALWPCAAKCAAFPQQLEMVSKTGESWLGRNGWWQNQLLVHFSFHSYLLQSPRTLICSLSLSLRRGPHGLSTVSNCFGAYGNKFYVTLFWKIDLTRLQQHWRTFGLFSIEDNTAMNILKHVFWEHVCTHFCWVYNQVELLGHRICIYSALIDIAKYFSKVIVLIYILTSCKWSFQLLHILSSAILLILGF